MGIQNNIRKKLLDRVGTHKKNQKARHVKS